jgi:hypothetical protein
MTQSIPQVIEGLASPIDTMTTRAAAALAAAPFHASLIGLDGRSVFVGVAFVDGVAVSYANEVDHEALNDNPERTIRREIEAAVRGWRERV